MEARNLSTTLNMTEVTSSPSSSSSSSSSSLRSARLELVAGIVCLVIGLLLAAVSVIIFTYTKTKQRRMRREEKESERSTPDLGRGNPCFETEDIGPHVGLPLPDRSSLQPHGVFSLSRSNYDVACGLSMEPRPVPRCASARQDSSSSSDNEVGAVCLHRTSPLAAIYLIYDELNATRNSNINVNTTNNNCNINCNNANSPYNNSNVVHHSSNINNVRNNNNNASSNIVSSTDGDNCNLHNSSSRNDNKVDNIPHDVCHS